MESYPLDCANISEMRESLSKIPLTGPNKISIPFSNNTNKLFIEGLYSRSQK